jgi:NADH:ubiquinone oxidoreductase subunit 6 (subunit J)
MNFTESLFWLFSVILIFAGLRVITAKNPVHSALFLVLAFFTAAGLWLLLEAEFLAITLVLVYVGAVMVLFLFVIMMLDITVTRLRERFWSYLPLGATVGALMVAEMALVLGGKYFESSNMAAARPAGFKTCSLYVVVDDLALPLPHPRRHPVRHQRGGNFFESQKRDHSADGDRTDAARGQHELHRVFALPERHLRADFRLLHPDGRGSRIGDWTCDSGRAVPQSRNDSRR